MKFDGNAPMYEPITAQTEVDLYTDAAHMVGALPRPAESRRDFAVRVNEWGVIADSLRPGRYDIPNH